MTCVPTDSLGVKRIPRLNWCNKVTREMMSHRLSVKRYNGPQWLEMENQTIFYFLELFDNSKMSTRQEIMKTGYSRRISGVYTWPILAWEDFLAVHTRWDLSSVGD